MKELLKEIFIEEKENKSFSILIIKPESIKREKEIFLFLEKKGYNIIYKKESNNWKNVVKKINYKLSKNQFNTYIKGYYKYKFGYKFLILLLIHKESDTFNRLIKDKGNWQTYQNKKEDSLRGKFGLSKKYNLCCDGATIVYCGFHCPKNEEELKTCLELIKSK